MWRSLLGGAVTLCKVDAEQTIFHRKESCKYLDSACRVRPQPAMTKTRYTAPGLNLIKQTHCSVKESFP